MVSRDAEVSGEGRGAVWWRGRRHAPLNYDIFLLKEKSKSPEQ